MAREIFIETPFLKLAAKSWHEEQENCLLALHGWMDNLTSFEEILPLLAEYKAVAIDLPGHGFSQHRAKNNSYAFSNWPLDVAACTKALSWPKFSILGHSLGASIACFMAALYPESVERLFLIEGIGPITSANPIHTLRSHISEHFAFAKKEAPLYKNLIGLIAKRSRNLPVAAAKALIDRSVYQVSDGYKWRMDSRLRMTSPVRLSEEQVLAALSEIKCPVLLFKAKNGFVYDEEKVKKRCQVISNLEIVEIPGGHHAHMEFPEEVVAHMRKFKDETKY